MEPLTMLTWVLDKIIGILSISFGGLGKLKFLVHEAYLVGDPNPCYFIRVTNNSDRPITVTHFWIMDEKKRIDITYELPYILQTTNTREVCIRKQSIKDHNNIFRNVYIMTSNYKTYRSKRNRKIPPKGSTQQTIMIKI